MTPGVRPDGLPAPQLRGARPAGDDGAAGRRRQGGSAPRSVADAVGDLIAAVRGAGELIGEGRRVRRGQGSPARLADDARRRLADLTRAVEALDRVLGPRP